MAENLAGATTAVFVVSLSSALTEQLDVSWTTKDGSGRAGVDYEAAISNLGSYIGTPD